MKKLAFFLIIFSIIFLVLKADSEIQDAYSIVKLEFIRYPQELVIKKDFKIQDIFNDENDDYKIYIYYVYDGETIVCKNLTGGLDSYICGDIAYYDNKGQKLPKAEKYVENEKREWAKCGSRISNCIGSFIDFKGRYSDPELYDCPFAGEAIYKTRIALINTAILNKTDIGLAIKKRELAFIKLKLDEIVFDWKLLSGMINNEYWNKNRRFYLKINKEISIKIRYE